MPGRARFGAPSRFVEMQAATGFGQIEVQSTRIYRFEEARELLAGQNLDVDALVHEADEKFMSAFVRAVKPVDAKSCCAPSRCND
jgi:arsenite methyltransferase